MLTCIFAGCMCVCVQSGFSPLHIAAHYGNVGVARLLIEHGADVNRMSDKVGQTNSLYITYCGLVFCS